MENFVKLGISERNVSPLLNKGFKKPTRIQELTIPILMKEKSDIIAQAQTGTGKTAAFGLPLIEKLNDNGKIQALILTPTRELAIQVCNEINSLRGKNKISTISIYGGQSIEIQFKKLKKIPSIVVGTPGRIIDHLKRGTLYIGNIKYFILDEADEMLNMGFIEDIENIFSYTPSNKRVLLFSATMPYKIKKLAEKYLKNYKFVKAEPEIITELTEQIYYEVDNREKFDALCRIIDTNENFYGLLFCQTKVEVDRISSRLIERGYNAESLHGDLSQAQRERTLNKFRNKAVNILVATDVAARGIDIIDLTHVINYSVPQNPEIYIHRIGRTGRAGKRGKAITFVSLDELGKFEIIKRTLDCKIEKGKFSDLNEYFEMKKKKINEGIHNNLDKSNEFFLNWAEELLNISEPKKVVSSILYTFYNEEFNEKKFKRFSRIKRKNSRKVRLFFAKGKSDNLTKRKLIEFFVKETRISAMLIEKVDIFENFSFFTVPYLESEIILYHFKKRKNGRKSIVDKAKAISKNN